MALVLSGLVLIILAGSIASARHPVSFTEQLFYGSAMLGGLGLIFSPLFYQLRF